jgi:hypothetical protein
MNVAVRSASRSQVFLLYHYVEIRYTADVKHSHGRPARSGYLPPA